MLLHGNFLGLHKFKKFLFALVTVAQHLEKNIENIDIDISDTNALIDFVKKNNILLTVVGPEGPLVEGIVNKFSEHGLKAFGPTKEHAILEGSKVFSKDFMRKYDIPTADYQMFSNKDEAMVHI